MRATRNRVYRKLYRGFESPYLRQIKTLKKPPNGGFFSFNQGDRGMCASAIARSTQYADEQLEKS